MIPAGMPWWEVEVKVTDRQALENVNTHTASPPWWQRLLRTRSLPVLQMAAGFKLMLTFFLKTGEVPQVPPLQRPRKYLGGKERDQPPFSAQDFSWTCSRVAWRPISIQNLCLSKVQESPATSSGEQSLSQRCRVVLLLLPLGNQLWGRNKQLQPRQTHP